MIFLKSILGTAFKEKRNLTENESYDLLSQYGISVPSYLIASSSEEVLEKSKSLGFPIVMKIISTDIIHKTDVGGVILNINNEQQAIDSYFDMIDSVRKNKPDAHIKGVLLYRQLPKGIEIIVGMTRDAQFGPTVMFGLGGIFTEILEDVSFRICPVTRIDVEEMIHEIKGIKILKGYRNQKGSDIEAIVNIVIAISNIAVNYPSIKEIDFNPIMLYEKGAVAVDAKVLL